MFDENKLLQKQIQTLKEEKSIHYRQELIKKASRHKGIQILAEQITMDDSKIIKNMAYQLLKDLEPSILLLGFEENGKAQLMCAISEDLVSSNSYDANQWLKKISHFIEGGGGGQKFLQPQEARIHKEFLQQLKLEKSNIGINRSMRIVIVSIIIILFVSLNLYIRISTLKYYKELIAKRIQFSFTDLFSNVKWNEITENKYPQDKVLLNRFRKHILITGSVFVLSIIIVILMLFILRNNI